MICKLIKYLLPPSPTFTPKKRPKKRPVHFRQEAGGGSEGKCVSRVARKEFFKISQWGRASNGDGYSMEKTQSSMTFCNKNDPKVVRFVRMGWMREEVLFVVACWFLMQQKKAVEGSKNMFLKNYFGNKTHGNCSCWWKTAGSKIKCDSGFLHEICGLMGNSFCGGSFCGKDGSWW